MDKKISENQNEWINLSDREAIQNLLAVDGGQIIVRKAIKMDEKVLHAYTSAYIKDIEAIHNVAENRELDKYGIRRAQVFEEGRVSVCTNPLKDKDNKHTFSSLIYSMHIYNSFSHGQCSRMHLHTGERTGHLHCGDPAIILSLKPIILDPEAQKAGIKFYEDVMPGTDGIIRYSAYLPKGTIAHIIFPQDTTHQFIGLGDNVLNFTIHSEEQDEIERNGIKIPDIKMQSIYLGETPPFFKEYAGKLSEIALAKN